MTGRLIHTGQALVDAVAEVPALPRRGGNVTATTFARYAGGSVNTLVAAARCGAVAVHAGAVGVGPNGDLIRDVLTSGGVRISSPPVPHRDTGWCIVLVEPSAERSFITTTGAERLITVGSLATSTPAPGDAVCVTGYSLAIESTRDPLLAWLDGLGAGVDVVLDPGDATAGLPAEVREHILGLTTVWTGNREESAALAAGRPPEPGEPLPGMAESLRDCAARLPDGAVVITRDGPNGCALLADGAACVVPGFPRTPVDTNGAGDVHTGALLARHLAGASWPEAARWANAAAAIAVTRRGPASAPGPEEIAAVLQDCEPCEPLA